MRNCACCAGHTLRIRTLRADLNNAVSRRGGLRMSSWLESVEAPALRRSSL